MSSDPERPVVGQRWTSDAEPELGLGVIIEIRGRVVTVAFPASDAARSYALDSAPIRRARFNVGEELSAKDGTKLIVLRVEEKRGLLHYHASGAGISELDLSGRIHFSSPEARLLSGRTEPSAAFAVRDRARALRHRARGSSVRGFIGGRIELIPHQLYIAHEVVNRHAPRVLLADEVGLGKTIEASLILHRLLVSGRISRALILVPESLLHQWLIELKRRFNLHFSLFDEERCQAIVDERPEANPFLDDQLVLASIDFLVSHPRRAKQAAAAGWDVLVVDEAHHLEWSPNGAGDEYAVVEAIAAASVGLLLLTATPEQLGMEGHFARLRLLDPNRYPSLGRFLAEADQYHEVAAIADRLRGDAPLSAVDAAKLSELIAGDSDSPDDAVVTVEENNREAREGLLAKLLDQSGIGRVLFRNTRAAISGFPPRRAKLTALAISDPEPSRAIAGEIAPTRPNQAIDLTDDPRIAWLAALLSELDDAKVVLICRSQETAVAIDEALQKQVRVRSALFHEGLTLIQRDRHAAWLADPSGARLLICSEIGSEGRNFQFVHHLVLFDLPLDPDLLEQRIGRLDRIGQTGTIHIHAPWIEGTAQEVLAGWHHRGLDSLARCLRGGHHLLELLGDRVRSLALRFRDTKADREELERLIGDARLARIEVDRKLRAGHDHLLELSSCRAPVAERLVSEIRAVDDASDLLAVTLDLFEHLGIYSDDLGHGIYRLNPEALSHPEFSELDRGDISITFDRQRALEREDVQFITWDHPLLDRVLETILGGTDGNSALVRVAGAPSPIAVEAVYVIECIAPLAAHLDRFLAPTPLKVVVDQRPGDVTLLYAPLLAESQLVDIPAAELLADLRVTTKLLPAMIDAAGAVAKKNAQVQIDAAVAEARRLLGGEVDRLKTLARVNPNVRADEIAHAETLLMSAVEHLGAAGIRLDALRVIVGSSLARGEERSSPIRS